MESKNVVTEFLKKKWKSIFDAADVNKDGIITLADADLFAERFVTHHNLDPIKGQQLKQRFYKIWQALLLYGEERMEPDQFTRAMAADYTSDANNFRKRMHDIQQDLVEIFDVDNDGKVSEKEYAVVLKCWEIEEFDENFVSKFPQSPVGYIPMDVWRDAWVTFFCNNDEDQIKEEKPVLRSLGLI